MQETLPEDLWFFIILLALLILAYLWNDKVSGNGGSTGSTSDPDTRTDPEPTPEPDTDTPDTGPVEGPERPPEIHVHHRGSQTPGEECSVFARFDAGTGQVQDITVEINDESIGIRERNEHSFMSEPARVREGENVLRASITTSVGTDSDSTGFDAETSQPGEGGPSVRADYSILDESQGHVRIEAEAFPGDSPIASTVIVFESNGEEAGRNSDDSEECVFEARGLNPGNYVIRAFTQDTANQTGEYVEAFTLKPGSMTTPNGGLPQGIFNPQINFEPEINVGTQGSGVSGESYSGDNWSIFLKTIRDSGIRQDVKNIILDILGGNFEDYPVSMMWVVRLMQMVDSLPRNEVASAGREVVNYTQLNQVRNIDGNYFNALVNIMERNHSLERKALGMKDNPYETGPKEEGEVDRFFKDTYEGLKDLLEESKKIAEIDEESVEDFYNALKVFERERGLIEAFAMIDRERLQSAVEEENYSEVKNIVRGAEQRAGVDGKLKDKEFLGEIKSDLQTIEDNMEEAFDLLRRADNLVTDEFKKDRDLETAIDAFEGVYLNEIRNTLEVLESLTD